MLSCDENMLNICQITSCFYPNLTQNMFLTFFQLAVFCRVQKEHTESSYFPQTATKYMFRLICMFKYA